MYARLRSLLDVLLRRSRFEDEMSDELRFHVDACAEDLRRSGVAPAEAWRRARAQFGGIEQVKEEAREARGLRFFDELRQDIRYALQQMRRAPAFTAAAIACLALGIGANTAIFSLMDSVLLKIVPVANPGQLYFLGHGNAEIPNLSSNYPLLERYRQAVDVFSGVTAYNTQQFKVATEAGTELVEGQYVGGNYHRVLGVPFQLGRGFADESDRPSERGLIAVISGNYWSRRFGGDPSVLGRTLVVQGKTVTIVGVTASQFHGLRPGTQLDVTLPLALRAADEPDFLTMRDSLISMNLVGRLKPESTETRALAAVDAIFQPFWAEPDNAWARNPSETSHPARLSPAGRGSSTLRMNYREPLQVLMAMVTLVLLIACANVANLLVSRAAVREKEIAIRLGVGAGRGRIMRQLLTESAVLAAGGGLLGLYVAVWGSSLIASMLNAGNSPILIDVEPNTRVLAFTTAVAMLAGLAFGLMPALNATRIELVPSLKDGGSRTIGTRRFGTGKALVVCQVALSILLLSGTGLLVRSLVNLKTLDGGFHRDNILLFYLDTRGTATDVVILYPDLLERLQTLPGVRSVSFSTMSPLATNLEVRPIQLPGVPRAVPFRSAVTNRVTADYLPTFDIPLVRGRAITAADRSNAIKIALINETMAREYFGEGDAIGRVFSFGAGEKPGPSVTVVGIVKDIRQRNLREAIPRMVYEPLAQADEPPRLLTAALRTSQDPRALEPLVRDVVRQASPDLVISYVRTMEQQIDAALMRERLLATLSMAFGALALGLACIGVYGVMATNVARRAREIGIRMALGARRATVVWQVLRETLIASTAGIVIGLLAAAASTRVVSTFLFGLEARDPLTLGAATAVVLITSIGAGFLPARRAAGVDPVRALKAE
jgi:predicted permease